jgi:hypothetical protein
VIGGPPAGVPTQFRICRGSKVVIQINVIPGRLQVEPGTQETGRDLGTAHTQPSPLGPGSTARRSGFTAGMTSLFSRPIESGP